MYESRAHILPRAFQDLISTESPQFDINNDDATLWHIPIAISETIIR